MKGQDFVRIAYEAFEPFLKDLGFAMGVPSISGRHYRVTFSSPECLVSVSFEPGDKALLVWVSSQENGHLSDMDDRLKSPRLSDLNRRYMKAVSPEERAAIEAVFDSVAARSEEERSLLKAAKELRLVLAKYLADQDVR